MADDYFLNAYEFSKFWVRGCGKAFSSEDVKSAYYEKHAPPVEPRVWGTVFRELHKDGLIVFHEYQKYKDKAGHGRPSTVWISREFSEVQSKNRGYKQPTLFQTEN